MELTQAEREFITQSNIRLNQLDAEAMTILDNIEAKFPIGQMDLQQLRELLQIMPAGLFRSDVRTRIKELENRA